MRNRGWQSYFTETRGGQSYFTETRSGQSYFTETRGGQSYFMRNRGGQSYFAGKDNFFSAAEGCTKICVKVVKLFSLRQLDVNDVFGLS